MKVSLIACLCLSVFVFTACQSTPEPLPPQALEAPEPRTDSEGEYVAPYTSDGVVAEWVEKAVNARMGSAAGGAVGAYAGQKAMENIPFVGGMLGQRAGSAVGRRVAIEASGGWDFIRETSDLSFDNASDLSVWLYVNHSENEHYGEVIPALMEIYPDLKETYHTYIVQASNEARARGVLAAATGEGAPAE